MKKMRIWYFINTQIQQKRIQVDIIDQSSNRVIISKQYRLGKDASETRDNIHPYIGDLLVDLAETCNINTEDIEYKAYYLHELTTATKEETEELFDKLLAEV